MFGTIRRRTDHPGQDRQGRRRRRRRRQARHRKSPSRRCCYSTLAEHFTDRIEISLPNAILRLRSAEKSATWPRSPVDVVDTRCCGRAVPEVLGASKVNRFDATRSPVTRGQILRRPVRASHPTAAGRVPDLDSHQKHDDGDGAHSTSMMRFRLKAAMRRWCSRCAHTDPAATVTNPNRYLEPACKALASLVSDAARAWTETDNGAAAAQVAGGTARRVPFPPGRYRRAGQQPLHEVSPTRSPTDGGIDAGTRPRSAARGPPPP